MTGVQFWQGERTVRDRADKPEYKTKINVALAFSNRVHQLEYYHNSSWLEHGGAPDKAARSAFVSQIDAWLKQNNKYNKNESKITFADVEDCLILVVSSFSNVTSYENQTKKAITNKGIQEAMTDLLRRQLEIYLIENPIEAERIGAQVLVNKRSREDAEKTRLNIKKKLTSTMDVTSRVGQICGLPQPQRGGAGNFHRGGRFRPRRVQAGARPGFPGHHADPRQDSQLPQGGL